MNDATPRTLGSYIRVKHGFAFKGEYFIEDETPDVLVTPGNFAIGGGFRADKPKYYAGPVPNDYILQEGDLVVTMTDLSKAGDTLGYPALVPRMLGRRYLHNQRIGLGVPPKLIIFNGFLVGAGAQHCQGQIRQRDRFATTMTIPTRNGDFGVTRAGSEWPARRAHSTACPNA